MVSNNGVFVDGPPCLTHSRSLIKRVIPIQPIVSTPHQSVSVLRAERALRSSPSPAPGPGRWRSGRCSAWTGGFVLHVAPGLQLRRDFKVCGEVCLNAWNGATVHPPRPAQLPGGQREGQPLFCGQQLSWKDPSAALGFSLQCGCGPGGCQPSDGQEQLSAALTLGTGMHHGPPSANQSRELQWACGRLGDPSLVLSDRSGSISRLGGWGRDPARCPTSSWAAGCPPGQNESEPLPMTPHTFPWGHYIFIFRIY